MLTQIRFSCKDEGSLCIKDPGDGCNTCTFRKNPTLPKGREEWRDLYMKCKASLSISYTE